MIKLPVLLKLVVLVRCVFEVIAPGTCCLEQAKYVNGPVGMGKLARGTAIIIFIIRYAMKSIFRNDP